MPLLMWPQVPLLMWDHGPKKVDHGPNFGSGPKFGTLGPVPGTGSAISVHILWIVCAASIFNLLLPLNLKMSLCTFNQSFSDHHAENLERLSKWEEEAGCRHGYDDKFHDLVGTIKYQIH